jgi:hypothetical protein
MEFKHAYPCNCECGHESDEERWHRVMDALDIYAERPPMHENALPSCFHCSGPVHGGPCAQTTVEAPACQACLYRAAQPNGLCDICEGQEQVQTALAMGGPALIRATADWLKYGSVPDDTRFRDALHAWLDGLAERWSHDATGSEMDAAETVARAYLGEF